MLRETRKSGYKLTIENCENGCIAHIKQWDRDGDLHEEIVLVGEDLTGHPFDRLLARLAEYHYIFYSDELHILWRQEQERQDRDA